MKKAGYFTVEAVFIVMICIETIFAICYGGLYVHDQVVLESVSSQESERWIAEGKKAPKKEMENIHQLLNKKLFIMKIQQVSLTSRLASVKISIRYSLSISLFQLSRLFPTQRVYEMEREAVCPAFYRWDGEILRERQG